MTVCIAAIAGGSSEPHIIAASDRMMSWGGTVTGETSLKFDRLHSRWAAMIAGDDVLPVEPIIRSITKALVGDKPTVEQVQQAIRQSWQAAKNQIATTHVLSAYNLELDTFIANGRELFGDVGFADLRAAIERASELSCELLVYGFDEFDLPTVFVVVHPGEPVNFSRLGFAAIGSGRDSAIASLMWKPPHKSFVDTATAIYRVAAAKFMAESAVGVGRDTSINGIRPTGEAFVVPAAIVNAIRVLWESDGQPRIPSPSATNKFGNVDWFPMDNRFESATTTALVPPESIRDR